MPTSNYRSFCRILYETLLLRWRTRSSQSQITRSVYMNFLEVASTKLIFSQTMIVIPLKGMVTFTKRQVEV